ncbi:protein-S-isoprenylcysteine O-methyltransferase isoform X1 [Dermatophagoides farinae]|uniref:protein-S-isoprenylcysteine O-methyltransferase isoform X1 n=1 Tax=Dermatophagoides farinae TaxID=6954 RepID=UPI001F0DC0AD|nr:protein-S-isoprenylcysteine O-methyltransferase-like isoform X2 [Dermatophagoides farinae]
MPTKYQVEIGRVALINFGPDAGKLVAIVDIIDQNRALIDGTSSGIPRQAIQFKRLRLTKFRLRIPYGTNSRNIQKIWKENEIDKKFGETKLALRLKQQQLKSNMTDFDRFKLYKTKQRYNRIVNKKLALLKFKSKKTEKAGGGLSFVFSFGLHLSVAHLQDNPSSPMWHTLGLYLMILSLFHYGEFQATAMININDITVQTFLLNHSVEYHLALYISLAEFCIESMFFTDWKFIFHPYITYTGLFICIAGDGLRKLAMFTAGHNFTHVIQVDYFSDHQLITTGIYSIFRHPSYVGWFYWSLGTQILLQNPISFIGYAIVSWRFFKQRIQFEEITLINFFGPKYLIYKKEVPTGLPWIDGY